MPLGKEVGLGPGDIVLDGDPAPPPQKGGTAPIFRLCLFWPNGCMDQDATWYDGKPRPGQHFVRCGPSSPPPKGHSPQFSSHICCSQMVRWITMPIGRKVGLDPSDIVLDGNPALLFPKQGQSTPIFGPFLICPNGRMDQGATWYGGRSRSKRHRVTWGLRANAQFSAHLYCGQTATWIKMPLGKEVGLGPGHIVLDGTQLPSPKRRHSLPFSAYLYLPNGCMDQDATRYGGRPRPRYIVLFRSKKGALPPISGQCSFSAQIWLYQRRHWDSKISH